MANKLQILVGYRPLPVDTSRGKWNKGVNMGKEILDTGEGCGQRHQFQDQRALRPQELCMSASSLTCNGLGVSHGAHHIVPRAIRQ